MLASRPARSVTALAIGLLAACSSASEQGETTSVPDAETSAADYSTARDALLASGRVDLDPSGNRVILGPGALLRTDPIAVQLDDSARWIVPTGPSGWVAVLDDGSVTVLEVNDSEVVVEATGTQLAAEQASRPPLATPTDVAAYEDFTGLFADPLPDTRIVATDDALVALSGPTDRYGHGVLGDAVEAVAIEIASDSSEPTVLVELDDPDVFEAVSPMIADVDADGSDEVVVTVSNGDVGARLVAYSLAGGATVAESEPIGLGNRWRNLLGVAPVGPDGEVEVIDIRTPHIGGTLQYFRVDDGRMELVASAETYSTHAIGSRNLDLGIVSDADGDGRLDVIVPTRGMGQLAVITRDDDADGGTREVGVIDLGGRLVTNLAAGVSPTGVRYAVGLDGGIVLVWP